MHLYSCIYCLVSAVRYCRVKETPLGYNAVDEPTHEPIRSQPPRRQLLEGTQWYRHLLICVNCSFAYCFRVLFLVCCFSSRWSKWTPHHFPFPIMHFLSCHLKSLHFGHQAGSRTGDVGREEFIFFVSRSHERQSWQWQWPVGWDPARRTSGRRCRSCFLVFWPQSRII